MATLLACEDAATPARGEVKPGHISSAERRGTDEATVSELVKALERDGHFLHPITVRAEGADDYRLIAGLQRLEAWKHCFGEERPIPAVVYPPDTPDALITVLEIEENLLRKELSAAQREAQTIRLAAALKKLTTGKPAAPVPDSSEAAERGYRVPRLAPANGGRGNKGLAQDIAEKAGVTKRAIKKRLKAASAVIGEKIDLHREAWLKAFDRFGERHQFRLAYLVCIRLGLDPLKMAPPPVFGFSDEDPEPEVELPAAAPDDATVDLAAEQPEDAVDPAAEDLQDASCQDASAKGIEAAPKPGGPVKCGWCPFLIEALDRPVLWAGRFYHEDCVEHAKNFHAAAA